MNHLFSSSGLAALRDFVAPGTLLALDYDGTLTAIRDDPADAVLPPAMARRLGDLARTLPTVILTGRASADIRGLLAGVSGVQVIGNHGAEMSALVPRFLRARIMDWRETLERRLCALEGVSVEDKGYSLSVHYRRSPRWEQAQRAVLEAASDLPNARIVGGKAVVNLVLPEAPDKGSALLLACRLADCRRAIYIGDDDTDEDVFALHRPDEILTVHVGADDRSLATYRLDDPHQVGDMLDVIIRWVAAW